MFGIIEKEAARWDIPFFEFGFEGGRRESGGVERCLLEEEEEFFVVSVARVAGSALVAAIAVDVLFGKEVNPVVNIHGGCIDVG